MASETAMHRSNLASESAFIGAHQLNVQADVMKTGLDNMGQMGTMNLGGGNGNMNPAGMMTSMMMGTAVAGQMGNMMNNMGSTLQNNMPGVNPQNQMPPTPPTQPSRNLRTSPIAVPTTTGLTYNRTKTCTVACTANGSRKSKKFPNATRTTNGQRASGTSSTFAKTENGEK